MGAINSVLQTFLPMPTLLNTAFTSDNNIVGANVAATPIVYFERIRNTVRTAAISLQQNAILPCVFDRGTLRRQNSNVFYNTIGNLKKRFIVVALWNAFRLSTLRRRLIGEFLSQSWICGWARRWYRRRLRLRLLRSRRRILLYRHSVDHQIRTFVTLVALFVTSVAHLVDNRRYEMMSTLSRRTGASLQRRSMPTKHGFAFVVLLLRVRWVGRRGTTTPRTSIGTPGVLLPRRRRDAGVVAAAARVPEHGFHSGFTVEMMVYVRYGAIARDFRLEYRAVAVYFRFGPEVDEFVNVLAIWRLDVLNVTSVFPSGIYHRIYSRIWKSKLDSRSYNVAVLNC